jgi:hypothetical protein
LTRDFTRRSEHSGFHRESLTFVCGQSRILVTLGVDGSPSNHWVTE